MADEQRQIRVITRQLDRLASRVVAKISLDVTANLVETTPVDTGWARANWVPSIGFPVEEPVGSPTSVSGAQQQNGQSALLGYTIDKGKVFVSNNVSYINKLNDGSSLQAPANFVQDAIDKALTIDITGLET